VVESLFSLLPWVAGWRAVFALSSVVNFLCPCRLIVKIGQFELHLVGLYPHRRLWRKNVVILASCEPILTKIWRQAAVSPKLGKSVPLNGLLIFLSLAVAAIVR
jgi:hypothetical protein